MARLGVAARGWNRESTPFMYPPADVYVVEAGSWDDVVHVFAEADQDLTSLQHVHLIRLRDP